MRRIGLGVEAEQSEANRLTASLAGLTFALLLVVVGLFLFQNLRSKAALEDCLLAGQRNCDQLVVGPPQGQATAARLQQACGDVDRERHDDGVEQEADHAVHRGQPAHLA